ncbi:MAG: dual specificity protein phosphatase family protein [Bacteroidales bacterium]|nr:dual specificity protein phosphatase family protein [Bacteroidales bacterium]
MKHYSFDNIMVRHFLTMPDVQDKYNYQDGTHVINVSLDFHEGVKHYVEEKGGTYDWIPLHETPQMEVDNQVHAVQLLSQYASLGEPIIVHCLFGINRSRTVVESYYYAKYGEQFEDEYKGFKNHLMYNIARVFLPPMEEIRKKLFDAGVIINQYLSK